MTKIPNLFLIGAPKSGTSALASALGQHSEVFVGRKEPRYFDARTYYDNPSDAEIASVEQYLALFDKASLRAVKYILDASVFNMYSEGSIRDILALSKNAKFILVLRDPLAAAKSMHTQRLKYPAGPLREISESFAECWQSLRLRKSGEGFPEGCKNRFLFRYDLMYRYELYVPALLNIIPPENLLCIDYESFKARPREVYDGVFDFLGMGRIDVKSQKVNPSYVVSDRPGMFDFLRAVVLPIVRRFPVLRGSVSKLVRFVPQKKMRKKPDSKCVDDEAQIFFEESYKTMKTVCDKYDINRR